MKTSSGLVIEINNLTRRRVKKEFIIKAAEKVLKGEEKNGLDLSIALVGKRIIRNLNRIYRNKDRATDVLAFGDGDLREVVICLAEVDKNAKRQGYSFEEELAKVLIHGVLHLLGYDHENSSDDAKVMEEKQEYYFSQIFTQ